MYCAAIVINDRDQHHSSLTVYKFLGNWETIDCVIERHPGARPICGFVVGWGYCTFGQQLTSVVLESIVGHRDSSARPTSGRNSRTTLLFLWECGGGFCTSHARPPFPSLGGKPRRMFSGRPQEI